MLLIGANVTETSTKPDVVPGTRYTAPDGKEFVYVQANGAVTQHDAVVIDETYQAAALSTSNDARGDLVGAAPVAVADDYYFWAQIKGPSTIRGAGSVAANVRLNATGTAGVLDDDGSTTAAEIISLIATTANGSTDTAGVPVLLNYPSVGPIIT